MHSVSPSRGKPVRSLAATRAHLAQFPRDAMVASPATGVFGLIGFSGRQGASPSRSSSSNGCARISTTIGGSRRCTPSLSRRSAGSTRPRPDRTQHGRQSAQCPRRPIKAHVLYEMGEDRRALDYLEAGCRTIRAKA